MKLVNGNTFSFDSSIRALLIYKANNPKSRLLEVTPQLEWLADPSYRTKVVAKPVFFIGNYANGFKYLHKS